MMVVVELMSRACGGCGCGSGGGGGMVEMFMLQFLVATTTCIGTATGYYNAAKQVGASTLRRN